LNSSSAAIIRDCRILALGAVPPLRKDALPDFEDRRLERIDLTADDRLDVREVAGAGSPTDRRRSPMISVWRLGEHAHPFEAFLLPAGSLHCASGCRSDR
jgi:hypothetical protein